MQIHNPSGVRLPFGKERFYRLLHSVEENEKISFSFLEVVFMDEDGIIRINREHLDREYITDIITFRYDEGPGLQSVEGSLYCCAPRILEQSAEYDADPADEFCRVFIHGLLHLAGYDDRTEEGKKEMTRLENHYLTV